MQRDQQSELLTFSKNKQQMASLKNCLYQILIPKSDQAGKKVTDHYSQFPIIKRDIKKACTN